MARSNAFWALFLVFPAPAPRHHLPQVAAHALRGGRERSLGGYLTRADTPHREPVAPVVAAAGIQIQATTTVVHAALVAAIARGSRPPVAVGASSAERASAVEPTKDRRESGYIASNTTLLTVSWEPPAPRADVVGSILC